MRFLKKITKIFKKGSSVQDFANTNQLNRWEKKKNLYPDWDERTIIISQYIPENSSISRNISLPVEPPEVEKKAALFILFLYIERYVLVAGGMELTQTGEPIITRS